MRECVNIAFPISIHQIPRMVNRFCFYICFHFPKARALRRPFSQTKQTTMRIISTFNESKIDGLRVITNHNSHVEQCEKNTHDDDDDNKNGSLRPFRFRFSLNGNGNRDHFQPCRTTRNVPESDNNSTTHSQFHFIFGVCNGCVWFVRASFRIK